MSKKYFYITTPIYYPSANLHIGHAYCTTLTDTIARYKRMQGIETFFLTGTDEHGEKIQKNAEAKGVTPQAFVDDIVKGIKKLWKDMKISNDHFIRTTDEYHVEVIQKIFTKMYENGDIYLGNYEGWYCTPCESFWTDTQAGEDHICPDCGRPVHRAKEEAYFFKMSKYSNRLMEFYNNNVEFITPESRKNEMVNNFIKKGLEDLCISRTTFSWGIPIRENPKHVVYVWLDALFNYVTALGFMQEDDSNYKKFWGDDAEIIHIIGNDITRFHTIYWPIFLMSMGMRLPDKIYVHGLIMTKDGKMSKSKGNVISPNALIDRYGVDTLRFYYVREVVFGTDGQFTPEQFVERINIDLANDFGNLLNRTVGMIIKYFDGVIPEYQGQLTELDRELEEVGKIAIKNYHTKMDSLKVNEAYEALFTYISRANKYIEESKPWILAKDPEKINELKSVMNHLANALRQSAILLSPALVEAPEKLFAQLGIEGDLKEYRTVNDFNLLGGQKVTKGEPLFPRLDPAVEVEYIRSLMTSK